MPTITDIEPIIIKVASAAVVPEGTISAPEWLAEKARLTALEDRPILETPGVDADAIAAGQVLQWDGTALVPWTPESGTRVQQGGDTDTRFSGVNLFQFGEGMYANPASEYPNIALIGPVFAGSGSVKKVPYQDHTHNLFAPVRVPIAPQGYMASGSRPLASTTVTIPDGVYGVIEAELKLQLRGGDPGPCYYRFSLTIDGNTRTSPAGDQGFWCVQGVPANPVWEHERGLTGTGAAVVISASVAWGAGGGGFYTDVGELVVRVRTDR